MWEGVLFQDIHVQVYLREGYRFSLVCKNLGRLFKILKEKGESFRKQGLRFRDKIDKDVLASSNSYFHVLLSYDSNP